MTLCSDSSQATLLSLSLLIPFLGETRVWAQAAVKSLYDLLAVENVNQYAALAKKLNDTGLRAVDNRPYTKEMVKSKINSATGDLKTKIDLLKSQKKTIGTLSVYLCDTSLTIL